ncbi:hypothetical protein MICABA_00157 [Microbacterium sp. T2.11-28]|nr:hypothetical protein MICABA_00157 [Microbacterium sp. T2.11-28]
MEIGTVRAVERPTRYERAASLVKAYSAQWGDIPEAENDLIAILNICHNASMWMGEQGQQLAQDIAAYVESVFVPDEVRFDDDPPAAD